VKIVDRQIAYQTDDDDDDDDDTFKRRLDKFWQHQDKVELTGVENRSQMRMITL